MKVTINYEISPADVQAMKEFLRALFRLLAIVAVLVLAQRGLGPQEFPLLLTVGR